MYSFFFKVQYFNFPRFYIFVSCSLPNSWHFSLNQRVNYSSHFPNRLISSCENVEAIIVQYCWHFNLENFKLSVNINWSGHSNIRPWVGLRPIDAIKCSLDSSLYVLMKNTLDKDHQMTNTLTPFQIFFSLIYEQDLPIILIPVVMQHYGRGEQRRCVLVIFILWNH